MNATIDTINTLGRMWPLWGIVGALLYRAACLLMTLYDKE